MTPRRCLVIGGATGIGLGIASKLSTDGHSVTATWHRRQPPEDAEAITWVEVDVTNPAQIEALCASTESGHPFEVLVVSAGIVRDRFLLRTSDDDFDAVLDVNLRGAFRSVRAVTAGMIASGWGRIILISSTSGLVGRAGQANYAAAKAGIVGVARSLAREVLPRGVTVNVVAPGAIATDLFEGLQPRQRKGATDAIPAGRVGTVAEVAEVVAFLVGDGAAAITGAVVPVDGALTA